MNQKQDPRLPLIVGVTGHRDLCANEIPQIKAHVEKLIDDLQAKYPELPLLFLCAQAEGSDALVADVAYEKNVPVLSVLPMPQAQYEQDFTGEALESFLSRLKRSEVIALERSTDQNMSDVQDWKNQQYQRLGIFLAAHSHLLLAIWDGQDIGKPGGTSEVVKFHQRDISDIGGPQQERPSLDVTEDESDLVYHIVSSRESEANLASDLVPCTASWLTRDDRSPRTQDLPERYGQVFKRMESFNKDVKPISRSLADEYALSDLPAETQNVSSGLIEDMFQRCDLLASQYQRRTLFALRTTLVSAVAAGIAFILYADLEGLSGAIYAYFAFVLVAIGASVLANFRGWQRRYVDYRVLAEALRVQYYWAQAGVSLSNPTRFSHDRLFSGRDLELGWIRNVLRFTGLRVDRKTSGDSKVIDSVIKSWVGDNQSGQLGYYRKRSKSKLSEYRTTSIVTSLCFITGLSAAAALALAETMMPSLLTTLLVALMGLLPLLAAARQNYAHRLAQRELVAQYAQMNRIFSLAERLLQNAGSDEDRQKILFELGESALYENAQWVLRQRERPLPGSDAMA